MDDDIIVELRILVKSFSILVGRGIHTLCIPIIGCMNGIECKGTFLMNLGEVSKDVGIILLPGIIILLDEAVEFDRHIGKKLLDMDIDLRFIFRICDLGIIDREEFHHIIHSDFRIIQIGCRIIADMHPSVFVDSDSKVYGACVTINGKSSLFRYTTLCCIIEILLNIHDRFAHFIHYNDLLEMCE